MGRVLAARTGTAFVDLALLGEEVLDFFRVGSFEDERRCLRGFELNCQSLRGMSALQDPALCEPEEWTFLLLFIFAISPRGSRVELYSYRQLLEPGMSWLTAVTAAVMSPEF